MFWHVSRAFLKGEEEQTIAVTEIRAFINVEVISPKTFETKKNSFIRGRHFKNYFKIFLRFFFLESWLETLKIVSKTLGAGLGH